MNLLHKEGFTYFFDPAACATCGGRCCRGESGYIWVNRGEIDRIAAYLLMNPIDFIASSVRQVDNRLSLRERRAGEEAVCLFFDLRACKCRIYPVRPAQCREFPFWEHFRNNMEALVRECPGVRLFEPSPAS
ncbi:MAG TPA: zinc/iron-chelating domain-containing protein [Desulfobulbaceae bacterium]|nr:zinc/iron-chelating domain-containing protein [Desulfobulbaceae bacterium]